MQQAGANTPGVVGYLLCYLLADLIFAVTATPVLGAPVADPGSTVNWFAMAVVLACWAGFWALPIAVVLLPVVHRLCRDVESQVVHVAVAGAAGLLGCGTAVMIMFRPWSDPTISGILAGTVLVGGVSTALARAAVIPLVHVRRRAEAVQRDFLSVP